MKQVIVQISGKQGAGKTTLANGLKDKLYKLEGIGFAIMGYADPVYHITRTMQVLAREHGIPVELSPAGDPAKDGDLLQTVATWYRKKYGMDVWVNVMKKRLERSNFLFTSQSYKAFVYIIHDLRFPNEAALGGHTVRLECPEAVRKERILATPGQSWRENTTHESEVSLDDYTGFGQVYFTDLAPATAVTEDVFKYISKEL